MQIVCEIEVGSTDIDPYPDLTNFNKLVALLPEARSGYNFRASLPPNDLRIQQILDHLRACGMEPQIHPGTNLRPKQFRMNYRRIYDNTDIESAELLEPIPQIVIWKTVNRRPDGVLAIRASELRTRFAIASAAPDGMMVADETRAAMVADGLVGPSFKPLAVEGSKAEKYQGRIWELASDRLMPPLSPTCRFVNSKGIPCSGPKEGGLRDEAPYTPPEFHYLRTAITRLSDFDLARTEEIKTCFIASKRFYQFCVKHRIPMKWRPVRVDDE
jgi:hypothetical protein